MVWRNLAPVIMTSIYGPVLLVAAYLPSCAAIKRFALSPARLQRLRVRSRRMISANVRSTRDWCIFSITKD
jgi:hypothetical protein